MIHEGTRRRTNESDVFVLLRVPSWIRYWRASGMPSDPIALEWDRSNLQFAICNLHEVRNACGSTFDIVSEFDRQELVNAVDQTQRDVRTRYDLKDSNTELVLGEKELTITADAELHLAAVRDIF